MEMIKYLALLLIVVSPQNPQQQKALQVQQKQMSIRDSIGIKYGDNTETLTFGLKQMADFLLKPQQDEQIKATIHTYWQQQNIYISSQYRQGEHIQLVIYEDNVRVVQNANFYVTHGFKFFAQKGKKYTVRFVTYGKVGKLLAIEISKSVPALENVAQKQITNSFEKRTSTVIHEIKTLLAVEQRNIILHERASASVNHSTCIYMTYLIGEAVLILGLVGMQVKFLRSLLSSQSII